ALGAQFRRTQQADLVLDERVADFDGIHGGWPAAVGKMRKSAAKPRPLEGSRRPVPAPPSEGPAHYQLVAGTGLLGLQFVLVVIARQLVAGGVELVEHLVLAGIQQV